MKSTYSHISLDERRRIERWRADGAAMSCVITMSQKGLNRLEAVQKIRDRRLSVVQAAEMLSLTQPDSPPSAGL